MPKLTPSQPTSLAAALERIAQLEAGLAGLAEELAQARANCTNLELQLQQFNQQFQQQVDEKNTQLELALTAVSLSSWEFNGQTQQEKWSPEEFRCLNYLPGPQGEVLDLEGNLLSLTPNHELFLQRVHPDDRQRLAQTLQLAVAQRHLYYESEYRLVNLDGTMRWRYSRGVCFYDPQGEFLKVVGISLDITERKQVELALHDSETLFSVISEQMPEGLFLLDLDDPEVPAKIIYVNEGACQMHGCRREDLLGQPVTVMDTPETAVQVDDRIERILAGETLLFEAQHQRSDGSCYEIEVSARLITYGGRRVILAINRDVSDRKQAERSLQEAEKQLRASLRDKDVLLKEVHHRVKNNLQIVSSLLSLQSGNSQNTDPEAVLRHSQQRIIVMAMVHERLYRSDNLVALNLSDYVSNLAKDLLASYIPIGVPISLEVEVAPVLLEADIVIPCGLIINELVSNATKYAFPQGRSGKIFINFTINLSRQYILTVKDDGIGFPEDLNFEQTESLGLQIVSALVRQLDGNIELDRTTGTCFTITFPILADLS